CRGPARVAGYRRADMLTSWALTPVRTCRLRARISVWLWLLLRAPALMLVWTFRLGTRTRASLWLGCRAPALTPVWTFRLGTRASLWLPLYGQSPALTVVFTCMKRSPLWQRTRQRRAGHATADPLAGMGRGAGVPSRQRSSSTMSIPTAPKIGKKKSGRRQIVRRDAPVGPQGRDPVQCRQNSATLKTACK